MYHWEFKKKGGSTQTEVGEKHCYFLMFLEATLNYVLKQEKKYSIPMQSRLQTLRKLSFMFQVQIGILQLFVLFPQPMCFPLIAVCTCTSSVQQLVSSTVSNSVNPVKFTADSSFLVCRYTKLSYS